MSILTAILISLYHAFPGFYDTTFMFSGILSGLWVGLITGHVAEGVALGAQIEMIFLGATGVAGGVAIQDPVTAVLVTVPIVLSGTMDTNAALALSVPIALVFAQLETLNQTARSIAVHVCDKLAEKGQSKNFGFGAVVLPYFITFLIKAIPTAIIVYLGGQVGAQIGEMIPESVISALSAVGGCMPAVGFGIIMYSMGSLKMLPFMLAGFFLVQYTGIPAIEATLIGAFIAYLYYLFTTNKQEVTEDAEVPNEAKTETILKSSDVNKCFWRWNLFVVFAESWERKMAPGFTYAMLPALSKFYKDGSDEMKEAMQRHMEFFNTEATFGAIVPGICIAMEEQKALGNPIDGRAITSIKTALMGPMAGIGDSLFWGCIYLITEGICLSGAINGSAIAAVMSVVLYYCIGLAIMWYTFHIGYRQGSKSAISLLNGGLITRLVPTLTVLGMFMIGALAANYVTASLGIMIPAGELGAIPLQEFLDGVVPGLVPLGILFLSYFVTKKFKNFLYTALIILCFAIICGVLGIIV